MDLVEEGMGPRKQLGLRRRASFDQAELSAILQGFMPGRDAQTKPDRGAMSNRHGMGADRPAPGV